jgi:hypothetical protein
MATDAFVSIGSSALEAVTGGRLEHGPATVDPSVLQGMQQLAQAVSGVGQNLAQAKTQNQQQMQQMVQQMMQGKAGH